MSKIKVRLGMVTWLLVLLTGISAVGRADEARADAARPTVYAWFPARFESWKTEGIAWDAITHLCFRSVELQGDGTLRLPAGDPPAEFVKAAHSKGVKVTVLVWVGKPEDSDAY